MYIIWWQYQELPTISLEIGGNTADKQSIYHRFVCFYTLILICVCNRPFLIPYILQGHMKISYIIQGQVCYTVLVDQVMR